MNTTRKNHVDFPIAVTADQAALLMLHHLALAATFFEAGPLQPEMLAFFDEAYPDQDTLAVKSQRAFLVNLNQEYVDSFDNESEQEEENDESSAVSEGA